jgi:hypothetical protein
MSKAHCLENPELTATKNTSCTELTMMGQRFMIKAGEPMGQWLTRNWNGYPS